MKLTIPLALLMNLASIPAVLAHATFENEQAMQNTTVKAVLRIPHGCNGEATRLVRITIPEGVIAVKPMPKAGWTVKATSGDYAASYMLSGKPVSKGVKEIVWSGGELADDHYDEFTFRARFTDALPADKPLHFPVVQECANGKEAWVEIPAAGQDPHALKSPAPEIKVIAARKAAAPGHDHTAHEAGTAAQEIRIGALRISQPWTRATPGGARVGGGFMRITNTGTQTDRLIGGSAEVATHFEVHEMRMDGNVMKMRALDKGLEIKPGQTIELKPGGYHVMFIGLKSPLKTGERVKGQLEFERAGKVEVEFKIEDRGSTGAHHSHTGH